MVSQKDWEEFWKDTEVISVYSDSEALEDGVLISLGGNDRMTRAVFDWLVGCAPEKEPPSCWPIDLMGWIRAKDQDSKALALVRGLIAIHGRRARQVYEQNIDGGIWQGFACVNKVGKLSAFSENKVDLNLGRWKKLWLMPNELGGLTLMFPEDY